MNDRTAILDACVLYPAPLRDLFMHLALLDTFRARWTEEIHDEWMRNVLAKRPDLRGDQLARTRDLMNAHVRDCLVENYESLIDSLELPDVNDRHVLAAAIHAKANFIVTFNLKDFPPGKLEPYDIEAIHPDNFIMLLVDAEAETVCTAAERQWRSLKNPPKTREEYLDALGRNGLRETVENLKILLNC